MRTKIHLFVAGGLAFFGLRIAILQANQLITQFEISRLIAGAIASLALLIAGAILFGKKVAVKWAWVYLTFWLVLIVITACGLLLNLVPEATPQHYREVLPEIIPLVFLWGFLRWSKSGKFDQTEINQ